MESNAPDSSLVTLPVTEEALLVGRVTQDTGGAVRVRKAVDEVPVELEGQSILDTVDVERVAIGRVVDAPPAVRREGEVTVIPVVEERAVLVRQLVLVEELRLVPRRERKPVHLATTLRKETATVERRDPDTKRWLPDEGG